MTTEPRWISKQTILVLHDKSIARDGGAPGVRDHGMLESALARPQNRFLYEGVSDIGALAATYAVAISANHPFTDGNKRAAFLSSALFMERNGRRLEAGQADAALTFLALAACQIGVDDLTRWLIANSRSLT